MNNSVRCNQTWLRSKLVTGGFGFMGDVSSVCLNVVLAKFCLLADLVVCWESGRRPGGQLVRQRSSLLWNGNRKVGTRATYNFVNTLDFLQLKHNGKLFEAVFASFVSEDKCSTQFDASTGLRLMAPAGSASSSPVCTLF
ncbi:unnamed protein product [Gongylonema pulchrum]|uniref:Secreted protein n=1 Tax=Gongylonema pulchrum TaxID=637853 RepID=A0A183DQA7_9BILA|nr:unnamed protein product [Gongylonema pulchrum]